VGALVGPDPAGAVFLHAHAREEAAAGSALPVRAREVLRQRPQRGLPVAHDRAALLPLRELLGCALIRVRALRQVDAHDVVRRAIRERGPLLGIDHVVGWRDDVLQPAGLLEVVVQRG